jgi:hypothetical protein
MPIRLIGGEEPQKEGGDVGPVPAPVAWTAAAMFAKSSSFSSRVAQAAVARQAAYHTVRTTRP